MAEDEPLKGNDSNEQEIGHNVKELLTIKTIGATVKKYWFQRNGKPKETKEKSKLGLSRRNSLLLSMYKEEWAIKIKNYINIERFLPFILIFITLFRFIYLNILLIIYFRDINSSSSTHKAACSCTVIIVYLIFLCRSIIDSLDTQIIPIFTYISVYYKFMPFKSHHVCFMTFWPFIAMILSYIIYGLLFCIFFFGIAWGVCDNNIIKTTPNIFWEWFIGWKYIINIFNGKWRIKYIFNWNYWNSFDIIYCNYFIMSYLPYLFLIGLVFGFLLIRHIFLNIKAVFIKFIFKTWKHFKQFYIILIPLILFRFIYLICMWSVFFFGKHSLFHSNEIHSNTTCDIILFTVFIIMIFHSIFDALCSPVISIEFFMYFTYIQKILNPILRTCLKKIFNKYIIFPEENFDNDYNQVMTDMNEQTDIEKESKYKNKKSQNNAKQNLKLIKNKLKISLNSLRKCIGKNGLIVLMS
eukprot:376571_1